MGTPRRRRTHPRRTTPPARARPRHRRHRQRPRRPAAHPQRQRLSADRRPRRRPHALVPVSDNVRTVAGCCDPRGCDQFFSHRFARRVAKRYRKRGLDKTARRIVEFLESRGLDGATVLEVGGGVGEIQLELLKRGARAPSTSSSRPPTSRKPRGSSARPESTGASSGASTTSPSIPPRSSRSTSSCCTASSAATRTTSGCSAPRPTTPRRLLVFSHPPRNPISRAIVAAQNLGFRLMRREFRTFAHPPGGDARRAGTPRTETHVQPTAGSRGRSPVSNAEHPTPPSP